MITTYNNRHVGDVLMITIKDVKGQPVSFERRGLVTRIFLRHSQETVAWNIFEVSTLVTIDGMGQVFLSEDAVKRLNAELAKEGFMETLSVDVSPKFVVGQIREMAPHPDSDHLMICQVQVSDSHQIQIVAGAPNVKVGLKTIVALPGAMLPNGSLIFDGELRGVASFGMMCSPRELSLPNAPQKRGVIELEESAVVGAPFSAKEHWHV